MQVKTFWSFRAESSFILSADYLRMFIQTLLSFITVASIFELFTGNSAEFWLVGLIGHLMEIVAQTAFGTKSTLGVILAGNSFG